MQKILITGASGFIGSFLVQQFIDDTDMEVYAAIRASSSKQYLKHPSIHFFNFDLKNVSASRTDFESHKFDYIVHCAGITQGMGEAGFLAYNAKASIELYSLLAGLDTPPKKFVYLSSLGAYGPADFQPNGIVSRDSTPHPVTDYGRSKLQAEQWIANDGRIPYIFIRPTAVYGPRDTELFTFFKMISMGIEAHIGTTPQKLTFIYVKDLVEIIKRSVLYPVQNKSYFTASETYYSSEELATFARTFLNKKTFKLKLPLTVVYTVAWLSEIASKLTGKYSVFNTDKINELKAQSWVCDIQPIVYELNYKNKYHLETGVKETLKWYKKNNWIK